jgi:hypothetical protein
MLIIARPAYSTDLPPMRGVNMIQVPGHPFGGVSARRSLGALRRLGADTVALIPFLWQATPSSTSIARGSDMPDPALRTAIREAHSAGLRVVVKPHIWIPDHWAGAVAPADEAGWSKWFASYGAEMNRIAQIAAEEKAEALVVGTELSGTISRTEWSKVIAGVRARYRGPLLYVAHDLSEAEAVPFWNSLDAIGISLYPPLGADPAGRRSAMAAAGARLDRLAQRVDKPVLVAEVGLRSAVGAADKPWESAEERPAEPDPLLQAQVLAEWFSALDRPTIRGVLVWRWFSDPAAGGPADTDFTVQNKPAEGVLLCAWAGRCPVLVIKIDTKSLAARRAPAAHWFRPR